MRFLKRIIQREDGIAMATVIIMISVMTLLSIVLIDQVRTESNRSAASVKSDAAYQAAESGINDYMAKLVDDPQFYDHFVANGESTRRQCSSFNTSGLCTASGSTVSPGGTWASGVGWTYPNGKNTWYNGTGSTTTIGNYAYNLMIAPPSGANSRDYVTVVSTGCIQDAGVTPLVCDSSVPQRSIEVHLKTTTPADFAFMYGQTPTQWGQTAATYGRIYVAPKLNSSGAIVDPGNICHDGTAYGDLMSEAGLVNPSRCYGNTATYPSPLNGSNASVTLAGTPAPQIYDTAHTPHASCPYGSNPACPLKSAVKFSSFVSSLTDVSNSAAMNTPTTNFDVSGAAWRIMFYAGSGTAGTVSIWRCNSASASQTNAYSAPTGCNSTPTYSGPLPKNGSIYTRQDAIIYYSSDTNAVVNGHVTVASGGDIVVGTNIHYQSEYGGANDDVLGLIAKNNVWVARFAPDTLFWRAAVIAQTGMESVYDCSYVPTTRVRSLSSQMTIVGSIADATGDGCAQAFNYRGDYVGGYASRIYASDDGSYSSQYTALKFLFPPWYPVIDTQTTALFREVPAIYIPRTD
jgi:Tfp pilus assembly protein PilX